MRYLALGDSFTIGTGTTPDRAFPACLSRAFGAAGLHCELRNPAVNGYRTDDLIRDELPEVASFRPDIVTVLIGANDIVAASSAERYRAQLRVIHEQVLRDAPAALRIGLPQPDWSFTAAAAAFGEPTELRATIERFNAIAREECERAGGPFIDLFPLMREQMRRGMTAADGLHPSEPAYAEWATALREALRAHGL